MPVEGPGVIGYWASALFGNSVSGSIFDVCKETWVFVEMLYIREDSVV